MYSPNPPIPHPHIVHRGDPPKLTPKAFPKWQAKMKSYLCCSSIELWRIVEEGFKANDPRNLTRREVVNCQLNATALYMIQQAVGEDDRPYIENDTTAQSAWNTLSQVFLGNASMRRNKFEEVSNQAKGFLMKEGEDHQDMYRRLKALAITFSNLGATHIDDNWVKMKYVNALIPFEAADLKTLKNKHNYDQMTSNKVMQEIYAFKVESKLAEDSRARALGMRRGANLTLKAKAVEEVDE